MIFNHLVKHNGVYYKAGEDVPIEVNSSMGAFDPQEEPDEEVVKTEVKAEEIAPVEETPKKSITKTEINRMSTAELKALAKENGMDDSLSGAELKKILIKKLV